MKALKVLVTGSTGFIGSHLVQNLHESGWDISVIVRSTSDRNRVSSSGLTRVYEHSGSSASMQKIVEVASPDVVIHLASLVLSEHTPSDVEELIQSNIIFGTQLVEAMTMCGVTSLVNTGTGWQHFNNSSYSPVNLYAASKQAFDSILQYYVEARALRVVTLKLNDTYGPADPRPKLLNLLVETALSHSELSMSDGRQEIDLVHVTDVAEAYMKAADLLMSQNEVSRERYSVTSGKAITLRNLVRLCEEVWKVDLNVRWGGRPYRQREMMTPWKGPTIPDWAPKVPLSVGLKATFDENNSRRSH